MAVRKRRDDDPVDLDNVIEVSIPQRQSTVSETLRARRIECSLDIVHVAEILRIRPAILSAIEDGHFDRLPGPAYAIGFVRSYATYLGLDAEALVLRFKTEAAGVSRRPHLHFPLPIRDSRVPTGPLLVICVLLAALTYAGWYYFNNRPGTLTDMVPDVPDRLHHMVDPPRVLHAPAGPAKPAGDETAAGPAQTAPSVSAPSVSAPSVSADTGANADVAAKPVATPGAPGSSPTPATTATATTAAAAVDGVPPVESGPTPSLSPSASATPDMAKPATLPDQGAAAPATSYGAAEGQSRVVLRATGDSWVQVRDKSGELLFTRVLKPGEHYNVPNTAGLTLIAGNAGGLDVTVDGMPVPKIGESGHVARNVSLDPEHLLGTRTHAN